MLTMASISRGGEEPQPGIKVNHLYTCIIFCFMWMMQELKCILQKKCVCESIMTLQCLSHFTLRLCEFKVDSSTG